MSFLSIQPSNHYLAPLNALGLLEPACSDKTGSKEKPKEQKMDRDDPKYQPYKILIIDDDPLIHTTLVTIFQMMGMMHQYIISTINPHGGIDKAKAHKYDLIFCDYQMTGICGDAVIAQIRKNDCLNHQTPIVGISGDGDCCALLQSAGANQTEIKPINQKKLQPIFLKYLPGYKTVS